ncbi:hypothetical protein PIROE2DRAFT_10843 [Piromyces sp. E2]|nr:hypothetical protein PIROE2DRAFT_10843 [Piromyces sp. E2]|eukprot:OUM62748.1 hypothetical protein PIROE2DRAFT_10843 [Piromyces sp. E2]
MYFNLYGKDPILLIICHPFKQEKSKKKLKGERGLSNETSSNNNMVKNAEYCGGYDHLVSFYLQQQKKRDIGKIGLSVII